APALESLGPALTAHAAFAHGVNAGFVRVLDRTHLALRVHERGAGWTQACGSGACAAMAVLRAAARVDAEVEVALPGGTLGIRWQGRAQTCGCAAPPRLSTRGCGWTRAVLERDRRGLRAARARRTLAAAQTEHPSMAELTLKTGLEAMDVAAWLRRHPTFLKDF
ncbi:Diaminopimelate epimerase, partial [mine drainage metagenome]